MMLEDRQSQDRGNVGASSENLEDSMQRLNMKNGQERQNTDVVDPYPDCLGEPNCSYFMRTGHCGYGSHCRFNHPAPFSKGAEHDGKLPEKPGQPDCQFYLKTGTCKYGATCKYHHPHDKLMPVNVPLNKLGLPMRQGEKACPYYMRNGSCKFGFSCKFHHPEPTLGSIFHEASSPAYGFSGSSEASQPVLPFLGGMPSWSLLPQSLYLAAQSSPGFQSLIPVIISPSHDSTTGQPAWGVYMGSASSGEFEDSSAQTRVVLPDRPDQPDCQYFLKTGRCKYGSACKYHHPRERNNEFFIGPHMLPLRPGRTVCLFYASYGSCKYGPACKFDHPYLWAGYSGSYPAYPSFSSWDASSSSSSIFPFEGSPTMNALSSSASPEAYNKEIKIDQDSPPEQGQTTLQVISPPPQDHSD